MILDKQHYQNYCPTCLLQMSITAHTMDSILSYTHCPILLFPTCPLSGPEPEPDLCTEYHQISPSQTRSQICCEHTTSQRSIYLITHSTYCTVSDMKHCTQGPQTPRIQDARKIDMKQVLFTTSSIHLSFNSQDRTIHISIQELYTQF